MKRKGMYHGCVVEQKSYTGQPLYDFLYTYYRGGVTHKERYKVNYFDPIERCTTFSKLIELREKLKEGYILTSIDFQRSYDYAHWLKHKELCNLTCKQCDASKKVTAKATNPFLSNVAELYICTYDPERAMLLNDVDNMTANPPKRHKKCPKLEAKMLRQVEIWPPTYMIKKS